MSAPGEGASERSGAERSFEKFTTSRLILTSFCFGHQYRILRTGTLALQLALQLARRSSVLLSDVDAAAAVHIGLCEVMRPGWRSFLEGPGACL